MEPQPIPKYDQDLIKKLQDIDEQIVTIRKNLYGHHAGCSCNDKGLCAHHAWVWNDLLDISEAIARAIKVASRPE